jgi:hypothetical protein
MNKVKYSSFTADFKLKIKEYAEKHRKRVTCHEFTVLEFNMCYQRKQNNVL